MTGGAGTQELRVGPDADPDKYRLVAQVGAGGEAVLWRAQVNLAGVPETVAVKVLKDEHAGDIERLSGRWAEQAELLRFIRHPSIVGIREHFEGLVPHAPRERPAERCLCLVMNWVGGDPLRDWMLMQEGRVGVVRGLALLGQVAEVLDHLHSGRATPSGRAVVHGDLSPGNVMITAEDQAVLVDFGLVRLDTHVTRHAAGTPGFAAPEVYERGEYGPGADRYGFAALGYFVLLGTEPPVEHDRIRSSLFAHEMLANASPAATETIMAGFDPDPARRPPTVEWLQALRGGASSSRRLPAVPPAGPPRPPPPVPPSRSGARWRVVAGAAVATLLVVLGVQFLLSGGADEGGAGGGTPPAAPTEEVLPADQTSPATPSTTAGRSPVGVPSGADAATVRRQSEQPIELNGSNPVDLDSTTPNWSYGERAGGDLLRGGGYGDGSRHLNGLGSTDIVRVTGPAEYGTCEVATGYERGLRVKEDDTVCVRTSDSRYAYLTIGDVSESMRFDVVVWDPPFASS